MRKNTESIFFVAPAKIGNLRVFLVDSLFCLSKIGNWDFGKGKNIARTYGFYALRGVAYTHENGLG